MSKSYDARMLSYTKRSTKPATATDAVPSAKPAKPNKLSRLELRALGLLDKNNNPIKSLLTD